jgi:hypothetical protein
MHGATAAMNPRYAAHSVAAATSAVGTVTTASMTPATATDGYTVGSADRRQNHGEGEYRKSHR